MATPKEESNSEYCRRKIQHLKDKYGLTYNAIAKLLGVSHVTIIGITGKGSVLVANSTKEKMKLRLSKLCDLMLELKLKLNPYLKQDEPAKEFYDDKYNNY